MRGRPGRTERRDGGAAAAGEPCGLRAVPRPRPGRERHGQGVDCAGHSRGFGAAVTPLLRRQLRGAQRRPLRDGAVRPRARRVHRGRVGPSRPVRGRGRRDAVPRRGRRTLAARAGQAAARHPGGRSPAGGREPPPARGHAHRRGHEPAARRRRPGPVASATTSCTGSTSCESSCRRCGSARRMWARWPGSSGARPCGRPAGRPS